MEIILLSVAKIEKMLNDKCVKIVQKVAITVQRV